MHKDARNWFFLGLAFVLGGVLGGALFWRIVYYRISTTLALEDHPIASIILLCSAILSGAVICATNVYFVSARHFPKYFLLVEKVLYCVILLLCLMFPKPQSLINLNPLRMADELIPLSPTLVLNIALFIPIGMMFSSYFERSKWYYCVLLCGLIVIETVQYAFSIGICDINDVIENFLGAYLGVIVMRLIAVCGKRASR